MIHNDMSIGMTNLDGALQVKVGTLFGRELIVIKKAEMEIQTWFFGFLIGRRKFTNELIRELRYEEWMRCTRSSLAESASSTKGKPTS